jgi:hypothetical protein
VSSPVDDSSQRPVLGQPLGAAFHTRAVERDVAVAQSIQPVRPRREQRDAECGSLRDVRVEAATLPEQLVAAMTQRSAHHSVLGQPRRGEIAGSELDHSDQV